MKILVLGGSGNLGGALARIGEVRGHSMALTFRAQRPLASGAAAAMRWDVSEKVPRQELFESDWDVIVHTIANTNPDACEVEHEQARMTNAESVRWVVENIDPRYLVFVSSDYVFDGSSGSYTAASECHPVNYYGQTKVWGEELARQARTWLVVRLAMFGAGSADGPRTRWETQLNALRAGHNAELSDHLIGTPLWAGTLAVLLMRLIELRCQGTVHMGGPESISKAGLLRRLAERLEIPTEGIEEPSESSLGAAPRPSNVSLISSPVVRDLAEYPRCLDDEVSAYATEVWSAPATLSNCLPKTR